jgi:hypothetical protein
MPLSEEEFYAVYAERESLYFSSSTRDDIDAGMSDEQR